MSRLPIIKSGPPPVSFIGGTVTKHGTRVGIELKPGEWFEVESDTDKVLRERLRRRLFNGICFARKRRGLPGRIRTRTYTRDDGTVMLVILCDTEPTQ